MPKAKSKVKTQRSKVVTEKSTLTTPSSFNLDIKKPVATLKKVDKRFYLALVILGVAIIAYLNKSYFVAAKVNGEVIPALTLNQKLNQAYRTKVLNQIVNERIIEQEAKKRGVSVSQDELNSRITETQDQYGGKETFTALLAQQDISYDDFVSQIRIRLLAEKMYENELKPTEDEIKKFQTENTNLPEATDEAKFRKVAEAQVRQEKFDTVVPQKFQELKQNSTIQIY